MSEGLGEGHYSQYEADVEQWVLQALVGRLSWPDLLRGLPGVYPSDVLGTLARLEARGTLSESQLEVVSTVVALASARGRECPPPLQPWRTNGRPLPVPHPLDFEWRFTAESADLLVDRCTETCRTQTPVTLIGAPTVFIRASERGGDHRYVLLDKNRPTVSRLLDGYHRAQVFVHDVCTDEPPQDVSEVTVIDPPWYDPYVRAFLWTASRTTRDGGTVLLSLPPVGTRPGISHEREALFMWATQLGLNVADIEEARLGYVSPPFEWNALHAAGIWNCPPDWRRGDLVTLRLRRPRFQVPPRPEVPPEAERWPEAEVHGVRVRFAPHPREVPGATLIRPLVPGDVLPSVSARDPRRRWATVWTSGNRVFACDDPLRLRSDLQDLTRSSPERGTALPRARAQAASLLLGVILRERQEYADTVPREGF